jgi:hypothetical protein
MLILFARFYNFDRLSVLEVPYSEPKRLALVSVEATTRDDTRQGHPLQKGHKPNEIEAVSTAVAYSCSG